MREGGQLYSAPSPVPCEAVQSEWGNELVGAFVELCSSRPDASAPRSRRRARGLAGAGVTPAPSVRACP